MNAVADMGDMTCAEEIENNETCTNYLQVYNPRSNSSERIQVKKGQNYTSGEINNEANDEMNEWNESNDEMNESNDEMNESNDEMNEVQESNDEMNESNFEVQETNDEVQEANDEASDTASEATSDEVNDKVNSEASDGVNDSVNDESDDEVNNNRANKHSNPDGESVIVDVDDESCSVIAYRDDYAYGKVSFEPDNRRRVVELYRQISRKGILSFYGDEEKGDPLEVYTYVDRNGGDSQPDAKSISDALDEIRLKPVELDVDGHGSLVPFKQSACGAISRLERKIALQTVASLLRNVGCYAFACCCVYLAAAGDSLFRDLRSGIVDGRVAVLVVLTVGFFAVLLQLLHVFCVLRPKSRLGGSVIASMVRTSVTPTGFLELWTRLRAAAPYIGAEICYRSGSHGAKRNGTVFAYREWSDLMPERPDGDWSDRDVGWVAMRRDYRLSGTETKAWLAEETDKFKRSVDYEKNSHRMTFDYVLDLQEGTNFPDAQAFLVLPEETDARGFYSFRCFKIMLFLCLDSIYSIVFLLRTRRFPDQAIVKVIK